MVPNTANPTAKCAWCPSTNDVQFVRMGRRCYAGKRLPSCKWRNKTKMHVHIYYEPLCPVCRKDGV